MLTSALLLLLAAAPAAAEPAPGPAAATSVAAADAPKPAAKPLPLSVRPDETMSFKVSYLGVTMGKVRLAVGKQEGPIAPVILQAQTSSIAAIVTLRQQLVSNLDVATGFPRYASLDAVEGSYRHSDTVSFDRAANKARVREKGKYDNTYLIDVEPDTLDFVALVWRLRALPLEPGTNHAFSVLSGRDLRPVVAEVLGRETLETDAGRFQAVKVKVPTGFTGSFSEKNPTFVWFSDDARRIVVQIVSDFAIGHATAALVSYQPGAEPPPLAKAETSAKP